MTTTTGTFTLKNDNRPVPLIITTKILATLNGGEATIKIDAKITPNGPTLTKTYGLKTDPNDATGKTIAIAGGQPNKMQNGGSSDQPS